MHNLMTHQNESQSISIFTSRIFFNIVRDAAEWGLMAALVVSGGTMKKIMIVAIVLALVGVGFWMFAPNYLKDKVVGFSTIGKNDRKCFNYHKEYFKDPETAYFVDSYIWSKEDELKYSKKTDKVFEKYDSVVRVEVQAKNGFGAYGKTYVECPLVDGKFNDHAAFMHRLDQ